tara:strand:+ start:435 stop:659 length:225 start_codon:yes stop_codon:yes gene_type:complete
MKFEYREEDVYWVFSKQERDLIKEKGCIVLKGDSLKHIANEFGRIAEEFNLRCQEQNNQMLKTQEGQEIKLDNK